MSVGFESKQNAQRELRSLMRTAKKFKKDHPGYDPRHTMMAGFHVSAASVGKYWRIKKVKFRKN
jgi:hypothetical protein